MAEDSARPSFPKISQVGHFYSAVYNIILKMRLCGGVKRLICEIAVKGQIQN